MSIKLVEQALEVFVAGVECKAIVFKGGWGTGKTFLWERVVKREKNNFSRSKYAYVSLFGLNSVADLKNAIFESSVKKEVADKKSDLASMLTEFENVGSSLGQATKKSLSALLEGTPVLKGFSGVARSLSYASVSDTLICIDDFERKGSNLSDRELLGVITQLVEAKQCSVVLILNDNVLKPTESDYFKYSEKVFDYAVEYMPSAEESVGVVFSNEDPLERSIAKNAVKLQLVNIRLLKKIKYFLDGLKPHLSSYPLDVMERVLHILPLAVWSIFGDGQDRIDIQKIKTYQSEDWDNYFKALEGKKSDDVQRTTLVMLMSYGVGKCEALDMCVIDFVEKGYVDAETLGALVAELSEQIRHAGDVAELNKAWELCNGSFDSSQEDVEAAFERALHVCRDKLSVQDVENICELYRALGLDDRASVLVNDFIEALDRLDVPPDQRNMRMPNDDHFNSALEQYFTSRKKIKPIEALVALCVERKGLSAEDELMLSQKSVNEFYELFTSLKGEARRSIAQCLEYGHTTAPYPERQSACNRIFANAYSAVLMIGETSRLNAFRITEYTNYKYRYLLLQEKDSA